MKILSILAISVALISLQVFAEEIKPPSSLPERLIFSGILHNENGEEFPYYFAVQRREKEIEAIALILDKEHQKILLEESAKGELCSQENTSFKIGDMFLRHNPITHSWVFGLNKNVGFNFKVDMLGTPEHALSQKQWLREGVEWTLTETGSLNGHFSSNALEKEQFVTANKSWFTQIVFTSALSSHPPLQEVLCEFTNGSAFYTIHLQDPHAIHGAMAGFRNKQGKLVTMSPYVSIKENPEGLWGIQIPTPKIHVLLENTIPSTKLPFLVAGITRNIPGFCTISKKNI